MMIVHVRNERIVKSTMNKDLVFKTLGSILAVILILWGVFQLFTKPVATPQKANLTITQDDVVRGNPEAPLTLVEYSDLQCPACAAYAPMVKQLVEKHDGKLKLVYRHFPLDQHIHATKASYAAEAAHKQGKFFEYQDLLFDSQTDWQDLSEKDIDAKLQAYAGQLKLDMKQFNADKNTQAVKDKVEKDKASGLAAGVNSTPSFFLDGVKISNPRSFEEFDKLITDKLAKQESTPAAKQK